MHKREFLPRRSFLRGLLGLAAVLPMRRALAWLPRSSMGGGHLVTVKVTDGSGKLWSAKAYVGEDPKEPSVYAKLVDDAGHEHPGLTAWFYADGVDVGACRADNAYDYINCRLAITYDGRTIPHAPSSKTDGTVDFWRGCRMPTSRYGVQAPIPTGADIDWTLLPSYTRESQPLYDEAHAGYRGQPADYTFNGIGIASLKAMGAGGERADIGYMSKWNVGFIVNQTAADWAVVRRADDWAGVWPIYYCDPATGGIIDRTVHPQANFLPPIQNASYPENPVVPYGGTYNGVVLIPPTSKWKSSGSSLKPNGAHLTSFALLSAMLTKTARDRDHASFWANYPLMEIGPKYTELGGVVHGAQRRFAWSLRNLFMGGYVSANTDYFFKETSRNLTIANALEKNEFGIIGTNFPYPGKGPAQGYRGMAEWMQNYLAMTLDAVSYKLKEWRPFSQYVAKLALEWFKYPWVMLGTHYDLICREPNGNVMTNFTQIVYYSLVDTLHGKWDAVDAKKLLAASTVEEAYNIVKSQYAGRGKKWEGKCVNGVSDFHGYVASPDAYPAGFIAAVVAAYNTGAPGSRAALEYVRALPTKPAYARDQKYHLVPRADT
ncbi:hypothetical protein [Oleiagrimonas sp. C23AA]|uniref:hypothetical protein n=1 Tax=Oleiagrimonas sp. C23AA TaxID=2719047 RepID=UPI001421CA5E|nr:hypothetical protein [Oleiagrimonas sp. C23AA]NII11156.1 hypothetical protein [Oleiagrimonas sp. C23AA]